MARSSPAWAWRSTPGAAADIRRAVAWRSIPTAASKRFLGSQDLGTGTRTVIATVLAETFGLPIDAVKVNIGSSSV